MNVKSRACRNSSCRFQILIRIIEIRRANPLIESLINPPALPLNGSRERTSGGFIQSESKIITRLEETERKRQKREIRRRQLFDAFLQVSVRLSACSRIVSFLHEFPLFSFCHDFFGVSWGIRDFPFFVAPSTCQAHQLIWCLSVRVSNRLNNDGQVEMKFICVFTDCSCKVCFSFF